MYNEWYPDILRFLVSSQYSPWLALLGGALVPMLEYYSVLQTRHQAASDIYLTQSGLNCHQHEYHRPARSRPGQEEEAGGGAGGDDEGARGQSHEDSPREPLSPEPGPACSDQQGSEQQQ